MNRNVSTLEVSENSQSELPLVPSDPSVMADARRAKQLMEDQWHLQWAAKNAERQTKARVAAALARA